MIWWLLYLLVLLGTIFVIQQGVSQTTVIALSFLLGVMLVLVVAQNTQSFWHGLIREEVEREKKRFRR